jgi:hypothetical protein
MAPEACLGSFVLGILRSQVCRGWCRRRDHIFWAPDSLSNEEGHGQKIPEWAPWKYKARPGLLLPGTKDNTILNLKLSLQVLRFETISYGLLPPIPYSVGGTLVSVEPLNSCSYPAFKNVDTSPSPPNSSMTAGLQGKQSRFFSERLLCPSWALLALLGLGGAWALTQRLLFWMKCLAWAYVIEICLF